MFCPDCGEGSVDARKYPYPPMIVKRVRYGYLGLGEYGVRIFSKSPKMPIKEIFTPYFEIFDVSFVPAAKRLMGFLCVRNVNEQHIPLPRASLESSPSDSIIWFETKDNDDFLKVYEFLKQCAIINRNVNSMHEANQIHCGAKTREGTAVLVPPFTEKRIGSSLTTSILKFETDALWLSVKNPKVPRRELYVSYNEVFDATFVSATIWMKGFLCIREWQNRHIPLPNSHWEKKITDTIIFFERRDNDTFYRAYEFIKQHAVINQRTKNQ